MQKCFIKSCYRYFYEQYNYAKIPHEKRILVEHYKGEKNYVVFHSWYGRRVNDVLSRAIGYLMGQKVGRDVEIGINDNGFYMAGENLPVDEALRVTVSRVADLSILIRSLRSRP